MSEVNTPITPDPNAVPPTGDAGTPPTEAQSADELILGKFKTVDDLKKSYTELEKSFHGKAPNEYVIDTIEDDVFKFQRDSVEFKDFIVAAKEANLSQAQVEAVLGIYKKEFMSKTLNPVDEIKKLGADGQEQVNTLRNWLSNTLSKQSFDAIVPAIVSSQFVRAMQELKGKLRQQPVPNQPPGGHIDGASSQETKDSWMAENFQKIKAGDPATLKEFDRLFSET